MSTQPPRARAAIAAILMFGGGVTLRGSSARAENCLSAPNFTAPPGKRWYYRVDHTTQQKCWYTRETSQAAERPTPSSHSAPYPSGPNRAAEAASAPVIHGERAAPPPPSESPSVKQSAPVSIAAPPVPETPSPPANTEPGRSAQQAAGQAKKRPASSSGSRPSPSGPNRAGEAAPVPATPGNAPAPPSQSPAVKPAPAPVGSDVPSVPETPSPPESAGPGQLAVAAGQAKKRPAATSSRSRPSPSEPNRASDAAPVPATGNAPAPPSQSPAVKPPAAPVGGGAPSVPETPSPPASVGPGQLAQAPGQTKKRPASSSHPTQSPMGPNRAAEATPMPVSRGEAASPKVPSETPSVKAAAPVSIASPPVPEALSPAASAGPGRSVQQPAGLANASPSRWMPSLLGPSPAGRAAPVPANSGEPTTPRAPSEFPPVPVSGAAAPSSETASAPASTWLKTSAEANAPAERKSILPTGSNDKSVQQAAHEQNTSSNPNTPVAETSTSSVTATQAITPPAVAWDPLVKPLDPTAVRIEAPAATVAEDADMTGQISEPTNAGTPNTAFIVVALVAALVMVVILFRGLIIKAARTVAIFTNDAAFNRDDDAEFYRELREMGARDSPFNQLIK